MNEQKNCKDCSFKKCLYRVESDFKVCPVEQKKQELLEKEKNM